MRHRCYNCGRLLKEGKGELLDERYYGPVCIKFAKGEVVGKRVKFEGQDDFLMKGYNEKARR